VEFLVGRVEFQIRRLELVVFAAQDRKLRFKIMSMFFLAFSKSALGSTILSPSPLRLCQCQVHKHEIDINSHLSRCASSPLVPTCEQKLTRARLEAVGDCTVGYHDPSQNLKGSLAWGTSRTAFVRLQYEGNES
jgi:hypothetical protein